MSKRSFIEQSKIGWLPGDDMPEGELPGLHVGALQRIAASLENIEKPYQKLLEDRNKYENYYRSQRDQTEALERRIIALKGVITKLKKRP